MSPLKTHNLKTHTCAAYCYGTVKEHHLTKVAINYCFTWNYVWSTIIVLILAFADEI